MAPGLPVFVVISLTVLVSLQVFLWIVRPALARRILKRWLDERGVAMQEAKFLWGHACARSSHVFDTRVCFRLTITDAAGETRTGHAVAGYRWLQCLSPRVDVMWDPPERRATG